MKYINYKIAKTFLFLFCLSFFNTTIAEGIVSLSQDQLNQLNNLPSVEVSQILLSKGEYKTGEEVYGSFSIKNDKKYILSNFKYTISLVGDYNKDGIAGVVYDSKSFGPEILGASEKKDINFIYKLSDTFFGEKDYGIEVRVYTGAGVILGWVDKTVKIIPGSKESSLKENFIIKNSYIDVSGSKFGLQEGPTITEERDASLHVVINNLTDKTVEVFPEIEIYNRSVSGELVGTFNPNKENLLSKKDNDIKIDFKKFIYKPGVYEGEVFLKNIDGKDISPTILFRYIIIGDTATIQGVTLDSTQILKNKVINLYLSYTGSPFDITTGKVFEQPPMDTKISLSDNKGNIFAKYEGKIDYNNGTSIKIPLTILSSADSININIDVYNSSGEIITSYKTNMNEGDKEMNWLNIFIYLAYIIGALVLIYIFVLFYKIIIKKI